MSCLAGHKLLFLPGLDGTGLSFEPLRPFLPPGLRVQVVTYPGHRKLSFAQTVQWAADQIRPLVSPAVLAPHFIPQAQLQASLPAIDNFARWIKLTTDRTLD